MAALYIAGVILGCLGHSCVEPKKYLVGASAGVYALIISHLGQFLLYFCRKKNQVLPCYSILYFVASLFLNWTEDSETYMAMVFRVFFTETVLYMVSP